MKWIKAIRVRPSTDAFTVWDLMIVLAIVALAFLFLLLFPGLVFSRQRVPAARIHCVSNLKQIGLAFRLWSNDHGERFPMGVSTNEGGTREFLGPGEVFRHFQIISNELVSLKILTCITDPARTPQTNFLLLSDRNLSYFVGLDVRDNDPRGILSGDRNVSTNERIISGVLTLTNNSQVAWTKDLHRNAGNLGLADGSAQQVTDILLRRQISSSTNLPAHLAIP